MEIKRYSRHIHTNFSDIDKLDLTWLKILVIGFTAIRAWAVLVMLLIMLSVIFGIKTNFEIMGLLGNYITFLMVSVLIFFGLGHSSVFEGLDTNTDTEDNCDDAAKEKIKADTLEQLSHYMQQHKPYLTPALTLDKLATQLKMPPRQLSHIINRYLECNFFEFINSYRVEEAKLLLSDPSSQKNMLDVMYNVGFNSKATFNTLFKKKVGMTPSEYRKQLVNKVAIGL